MIAIGFNFNASGFHATQWGRHVNEGVPEWPPSPWRILRALVSVWMRTMPEVPPDTVVPILELLAQEPPSFHLPTATAAHTRHYMPYFEGRTSTEEKRTMVIDSYVAVEHRDVLAAIWPGADLTPGQRAILAALVANLGYLGRAESWCEALLLDAPPEANCLPMEGEAPMPPGDWEVVRVLVPKTPLRLRDLSVETADLRGQGKIEPPGARWCQYLRPQDCFSVGRRDTSVAIGRQQPTVFRYALAGNVLPLITDTLRIGELARRAAMSKYGAANNRAASPVLSGKGPDGAYLQGHQHAFYLPTDENGNGHIDHLTVWAPAGLNDREMEALARIRCLDPGGGRPALRLAFLACGEPEEFQDSVPIFRKSQAWRTSTPFVLNRHIKRRGAGQKRLVDGPEEQVRKEVARRAQEGESIPWGATREEPQQEAARRKHIASALESVDPVPGFSPQGWRTLYPLEFYRWRRNGPRGSGGAFNFCLRFSEPVAGPIALGYGCHFGLGLFVPVDQREEG